MYILFNSQTAIFTNIRINLPLYYLPLPLFMLIPCHKTILHIGVIVFCIKNNKKWTKKWKNDKKKTNKKKK